MPASKRLAAVLERIKQDPGLPNPNPTISYWQVPVNDAVSTLQSSELPSKTDIAVIGSGISGCSIARHLLSQSHDPHVTVFDARAICSGATGRNGGHVKAVPEFAFDEVLPVVGKEKTLEILQYTLANVEAVLELSASLSPELQSFGEVRRVESLNLFTSDDLYDEMGKMLEAFARELPEIGWRGTLVSREELASNYNVHNAAGAYLAPAGAAWPYRLITGLWVEMVKSYKDRLSIEANTPVEAIEVIKADSEGYKYMLSTPRGSTKAKTIIHATNGHSAHLLPGLRGPLYPVRGQMTAQAPTSVFGTQGATRSWSVRYSSGFDYMTQSGKSGEIFIGGGLAQADGRGLSEIGNVRDDVQSPLARAHLGGIINTVWGSAPSQAATTNVITEWTGVMGFTADALPLVGKVPSSASGRDGEAEWASVGFNGYGMCNTWLAGKYIANLVLGKSHEDAGMMPSAYVLTAERLKHMDPEPAIKGWMSQMGVD